MVAATRGRHVRARELWPFRLVLLAIALVTWVCLAGCAARSAPVVVAQATLGVAQTIGQLQDAATQLHAAGLIDTRQALRVQERLLVINGKVADVVPYLRAIDRLQQSGVTPTKGEVDGVLTQIFLVLQELSLVGIDVPTSSQTKAFLDLIRTSQQTVTTTLIEIARLRVALES